MLKRDLNNIKKKRVLEIGPGTWDFAKKIFEKNDCDWNGIEPLDAGEKNLTIVKGSVKNIPYHDNSFDIVLCNQTIEHWFEYNVSIRKALEEIHRVLKPGGKLMINAPIHNHGDPRFIMGELKKVRSEFKKDMWSINLFEKVFPSKKLQGWRKIAAKGFFSKFGYPDFLIPDQKRSSTYLLNIHARKKKTKIKSKKDKRLRYASVILRFIKTYIKTRTIFYFFH